MKRGIIIITSCFAILTTACKKEYVCVCTNSNTGKSSYGDHFKTGPFLKKTAEASCENNDKISGGSLKDCHLE